MLEIKEKDNFFAISRRQGIFFLKQNRQRTFEFYRNFSGGDSSASHCLMADMYLKAEGDKMKNIKRAIKHYTIAARFGNSSAVLGMAHIFEKGPVSMRDSEVALFLYLTASYLGSQKARLKVSSLFNGSVTVDDCNFLDWKVFKKISNEYFDTNQGRRQFYNCVTSVAVDAIERIGELLRQ